MKYIISVIALFCSVLSLQAQEMLSEDALRLRALYEQLQEFKNDPEFHQVGYGQCCRFHDWLNELTELNERSGLALLREVGFVPDDLRMLGREYMRSEGSPTSYTQSMEPTFKNGLYPE